MCIDIRGNKISGEDKKNYIVYVKIEQHISTYEELIKEYPNTFHMFDDRGLGMINLSICEFEECMNRYKIKKECR